MPISQILVRSTLALLAALMAVTTVLRAQSRTYPLVPHSEVVDEYSGTLVPDPYRGLEDLESPATKTFIASQNEVTQAYLARVNSRAAIRRRLAELWNYPRVGVPRREAGRLFYTKNTGLQRQSVLYTRSNLTAGERPILDPNRISPDGSVAFAGHRVSPDGRYLAYGLAQGGSDFSTWRVRELKTGRTLSDSVAWVKFSGISWTLDGRGFFYARYPEPEPGKVLSGAAEHHRVYYHRVGTPQSSDQLVYQDPGGGRNNRLYYTDLGMPRRPKLYNPVVKLIDRDSAEYRPIGNVGDTLYFRTDVDASKRRIVAVVLPDISRAHWRTVVPEHDDVIEDAVLAGGRLVVQYLRDVNPALAVTCDWCARERESGRCTPTRLHTPRACAGVRLA